MREQCCVLSQGVMHIEFSWSCRRFRQGEGFWSGGHPRAPLPCEYISFQWRNSSWEFSCKKLVFSQQSTCTVGVLFIFNSVWRFIYGNTTKCLSARITRNNNLGIMTLFNFKCILWTSQPQRLRAQLSSSKSELSEDLTSSDVSA